MIMRPLPGTAPSCRGHFLPVPHQWSSLPAGLWDLVCVRPLPPTAQPCGPRERGGQWGSTAAGRAVSSARHSCFCMARHAQQAIHSTPCTAGHQRHAMHSRPSTARHAQQEIHGMPCTAGHPRHAMHNRPSTARHAQQAIHSTPCTGFLLSPSAATFSSVRWVGRAACTACHGRAERSPCMATAQGIMYLHAALPIQPGPVHTANTPAPPFLRPPHPPPLPPTPVGGSIEKLAGVQGVLSSRCPC